MRDGGSTTSAGYVRGGSARAGYVRGGRATSDGRVRASGSDGGRGVHRRGCERRGAPAGGTGRGPGAWPPEGADVAAPACVAAGRAASGCAEACAVRADGDEVADAADGIDSMPRGPRALSPSGDTST